MVFFSKISPLLGPQIDIRACDWLRCCRWSFWTNPLQILSRAQCLALRSTFLAISKDAERNQTVSSWLLTFDTDTSYGGRQALVPRCNKCLISRKSNVYHLRHMCYVQPEGIKFTPSECLLHIFKNTFVVIAKFENVDARTFARTHTHTHRNYRLKSEPSKRNEATILQQVVIQQ